MTVWFRLWASQLAAQRAAALTIAHRLPILAAATFTNSPRARKESRRMISEKIDAALEGGAIAAREARILGARLPPASAGDWAALALAAQAPALKAVKANARRLSRRRA